MRPISHRACGAILAIVVFVPPALAAGPARFPLTITADKPLKLAYRIWLQPGEMTPEQIDAMAKDFTEPPQVAARRI